jgi:PadR family transcriptional regulator PadR
MTSPPRMTMPTLLVLGFLLDRRPDEAYGFEITRETGLSSGTIHPILARMADAGWVTSRREDVNPANEGRPPRRYYRLTEAGVEQGGDLLAGAQAKLSGTALARAIEPRQP